MSQEGVIEVSDDCHAIRVDLEAMGRGAIRVEGLSPTIWQAEESMQPIGDPTIQAAVYPGHAAIRDEMLSAIHSAAEQQSANTHGLGGKKVRGNGVWQSPALRLLTLRALLMFCKQYRTGAAHVTDRWANVMEPTDYSAAHSHYESAGSVIYLVDPGETNPQHPLSGLFEIMDPRIAFCCSQAPERPTRGLIPQMMAGLMLLFPSELLHSVHPYYGTRPRVTLAWNINPGQRPAGARPSMEDQVPGFLGQ
jgi:hypothetical protein